MDLKDHKVIKEYRARLVSKGHKVILDHEDHKENKEYREKLVNKDRKVILDLKDLLDHKDRKVLQVQQVLMVQMVPRAL